VNFYISPEKRVPEKFCNISATVRMISTKFGKMMQNGSVQRIDSPPASISETEIFNSHAEFSVFGKYCQKTLGVDFFTNMAYYHHQ